MKEAEPRKETIGKAEIFFLSHPGPEQVFSGYGLTMVRGSSEFLVGLLMIDRPHAADPAWLADVEATFGEYRLVPMTPSGERGIACQMQVEPDSLQYLRRYAGGQKEEAIGKAIQPLLEDVLKPAFRLRWDESARLWRSEFIAETALPPDVRTVFEQFGHGCLAVETTIGVVHVCHASEGDIEGFAGKPVLYQWQLVKMPTAPLIRLEVMILDQPATPYRFESFLDVAEEDQARVLTQAANQDRLYLSFYGTDLSHRFTKVVAHDAQQWQYLDELVREAIAHWHSIPPARRDFDLAKAAYMRRFP